MTLQQRWEGAQGGRGALPAPSRVCTRIHVQPCTSLAPCCCWRGRLGSNREYGTRILTPDWDLAFQTLNLGWAVGATEKGWAAWAYYHIFPSPPHLHSTDPWLSGAWRTRVLDKLLNIFQELTSTLLLQWNRASSAPFWASFCGFVVFFHFIWELSNI